MKIGITLNEVLRDFIGQLVYTYEKYYPDAEKFEETDITSFDLLKYLDFDDVGKLNTFLYMEAALEMFGHNDQMADGLMNNFNRFLMEVEDDEEHQIKIVSREADKSIPSTLFFLSKTACKATDIKFVRAYADKWDDVDLLITANPTALEARPEGKISVKVKTLYNEDVKADYEIDSILDLINDVKLRDTIFNTQITNFEEID